MKFIPIDGKYVCSSCGYRLAHDEYKDIVLNCPACGEKKDDENAGEQLMFEGAKKESEVGYFNAEIFNDRDFRNGR